jgi:uncharacterized ferredoxin-like protein
MKVFVLTEEALKELALHVAGYARAFPDKKAEDYIWVAMNHTGEDMAEVAFSYEEKRRMRLADHPEEK